MYYNIGHKLDEVLENTWKGTILQCWGKGLGQLFPWKTVHSGLKVLVTSTLLFAVFLLTTVRYIAHTEIVSHLGQTGKILMVMTRNRAFWSLFPVLNTGIWRKNNCPFGNVPSIVEFHNYTVHHRKQKCEHSALLTFLFSLHIFMSIKSYCRGKSLLLLLLLHGIH